MAGWVLAVCSMVSRPCSCQTSAKVYTVLQKLATRGGEESAIRVFNLILNTYTFGTAPLTNLIALYLRIVGGAKPS